jgi:hypothetical protein
LEKIKDFISAAYQCMQYFCRYTCRIEVTLDQLFNENMILKNELLHLASTLRACRSKWYTQRSAVNEIDPRDTMC